MKKSLAALKRDANEKKLKVVMTYRYGEKIPERLQGVRTVVGANSVALLISTQNGEISELRIKYSALIEYTGDKIIVYNAAERELTPEEEKCMAEWDVIYKTPKYQEHLKTDLLCDTNYIYWKRKDFFKKNKKEYLLGYEFKQGKKMNWQTHKVIDMHIRGERSIEYSIVKETI